MGRWEAEIKYEEFREVAREAALSIELLKHVCAGAYHRLAL
jgi:hypothetical protein